MALQVTESGTLVVCQCEPVYSVDDRCPRAGILPSTLPERFLIGDPNLRAFSHGASERGR